jgi:hypothetical protein
MYGGHVWLLCYLYVWGSCLVIVLLVWMGVMFGYCVTCMDGGHVWLVWMWVMFGYCVNDDPFKRT